MKEDKIVRIQKAEDPDEPFKTIYKHLEQLGIGKFLYIHKEVYARGTIKYLLICLNAALRKRGELQHFEAKVIADPAKSYDYRIVQVTRLKEKTIYEKTV